MIRASYTELRDNLAMLLDRVENEREVLMVTRRGHGDVAVLAAEELSSLLETAYLLQSPANARRLLEALRESLSYEGPAQSIDELRREFGLDGP